MNRKQAIAIKVFLAILFLWIHSIIPPGILGQPIEQPIPNSKGPIVEGINNSTDNQKKELIRKNAKYGQGFLKFNGRWELIDEIGEPDIALAWAMWEKEPLHSKIIDVLEKVFPKAADDKVRFQIALLLYRYKREPGRDFLIKLLREEGIHLVAVILAENNEREALEDLLKHFENVEFKDFKKKISKRFIWNLGRFGFKADKVLEKGFLRRSQRSDYLVAYCLGEHSIKEFAKKSLNALSIDMTASRSTRQLAAAALLNFNPNNTTAKKHILESIISSQDYLGFKWFPVLQVIARHKIELNRVSRDFEEIIRSKLEIAGSYSDEFITDLIRFLLKIGHKNSSSLALEFLEKFWKDNRFNPNYKIAIALALVASNDNQEIDRRLNALFGKGTAQAYRNISMLNSIPSELLPKISVFAFSGDRYIQPNQFLEQPNTVELGKYDYWKTQQQKFKSKL